MKGTTVMIKIINMLTFFLSKCGIKMGKTESNLGYFIQFKGFNIEKQKKTPKYHRNRYNKYQKKYTEFDIETSNLVLDVGSGSFPFPFATHLIDSSPNENFHRGGGEIKLDHRPFIVCNVEYLPFKSNSFDYILCSHVLEHVDNPKKACNEIMRVASKGYIETPTRLSDIMYNYTRIHKWNISAVDDTLVFIEYSDREKKGTGISSFEKMLNSEYQNPFQNLVTNNQDLFVNMLQWKNKFNYYVFDKNGEIK